MRKGLLVVWALLISWMYDYMESKRTGVMIRSVAVWAFGADWGLWVTLRIPVFFFGDRDLIIKVKLPFALRSNEIGVCIDDLVIMLVGCI